MAHRTDHTSAEDRRTGEADQWWLIAAAGLAVLMASVDLSVVNVALPAIEADLDISTSIAEWVLLAYLLPLAGLALPAGRWLDSVGRRPAWALSVTGFGVASVAAGLAPDVGMLLTARAAQGVFGALLFALVPALATTAVRAQARGRAMGLITTLGPLGLVVGPAVGGLIIDRAGWPWIFFINAPLCVVVLIVGLRQLPTGARLHRPDRAWITEALLLSSAVAALLLALTFAANDGPIWLSVTLAPVLLVLRWLRLPASAAIRGLLPTPGVWQPHVALGLAATTIGVVFLIVPYYLQRLLGESATAAGVTLLAFPAGMAIAGPVGGVLGDWWGLRRTATLGAALFTVGLGLLLPLDSAWTSGDLAWRLFLAGCGNGLFNAPNMALAMTNTPRSLLATAGASTSLARQLGFALGPALGTLLWSTTGYQPGGMRAAMALAVLLGAGSVAALTSHGWPRPEPAGPSRHQAREPDDASPGGRSGE